MKPRRVVLTLEVETDAPLRMLKTRAVDSSPWYFSAFKVQVLQVQANVVRSAKRVARKVKR